ncbi:MAG: CT253 family lipoprotein [Chlamydiota bacterium]
MVQIILFLCLALVATCCNKPHVNEQSSYYENGTAKPVVTLVPLIDQSHHSLPWNLSDEFAHEISHHLLKRGNFFLKTPPHIKKKRLIYDPSSVKSHFPKTEFVVFIELIQHEEIPLTHENENSPAELQVGLQVRVLDIRGAEPLVILEKVFTDTQYLPKHFTRYNFLPIPWGKEAYSITPFGQVHAKLARQISGCIENHITEIVNHGL